MNAVATGGDQHQHQQDDQNSMEQNNNNIISSSSESLPSLSPTLSYSSSSSLVKENERLRKELLLLRHEMRQMEETQNQKQHNHQNHSRPFLPTTPEDKSIDNSPTIRRIILELPVTLRNYAMMSCNNNNNKSNGSNVCNKICSSRHPQTDKSSLSTADDQETVEPPMDIEAHHSSAVGLYHRNSISKPNNSSANTNTSYSTRKTERLMDESSSSSEHSYDGDHNDDNDPLFETHALIDHSSARNSIQKNRHMKTAQTGITTEGRTSVVAGTSMIDNGNNTNRGFRQAMTFWESLVDRASWLIGLLIFQSLSSFILARNESLLQHHTVIVQFLTMLVGAGGNAGNQASVGVVRGIAVGTIHKSNARRVLVREFAMGLTLSLIIGFTGLIRAKVFAVPWLETVAITTSLFMIVAISVAVGATLPLCMEAVGIDPAHSSTTIQVVMDITGVIITVQVSSLLLDSDFHDWLVDEFNVQDRY